MNDIEKHPEASSDGPPENDPTFYKRLDKDYAEVRSHASVLQLNLTTAPCKKFEVGMKKLVDKESTSNPELLEIVKSLLIPDYWEMRVDLEDQTSQQVSGIGNRNKNLASEQRNRVLQAVENLRRALHTLEESVNQMALSIGLEAQTPTNFLHMNDNQFRCIKGDWSNGDSSVKRVLKPMYKSGEGGYVSAILWAYDNEEDEQAGFDPMLPKGFKDPVDDIDF